MNEIIGVIGQKMLNDLVELGVLVPKRYRFDLVRWDDRDVLQHMVFIGSQADVPRDWAITRRRPLHG